MWAKHAPWEFGAPRPFRIGPWRGLVVEGTGVCRCCAGAEISAAYLAHIHESMAAFSATLVPGRPASGRHLGFSVAPALAPALWLIVPTTRKSPCWPSPSAARLIAPPFACWWNTCSRRPGESRLLSRTPCSSGMFP